MYYYIHISERIYSDLCRVKRIFYRNPKPLNGHAPFFLAILDPLDKNERIYSDFYALFKPILAIIVGGLNRSDWVGMLRFQHTLPFSLWFPKLVDIFKQKSRFLEYIYSHVCDYNLNRMTIEANTEDILKRQDEILAKINELKHPITLIPPNINGMFIRGHHIKLRYVVAIVAIILTWAVTASVSSLKYKEKSFAHYSIYRAVKEQCQSYIEKWATTKEND